MVNLARRWFGLSWGLSPSINSTAICEFVHILTTDEIVSNLRIGETLKQPPY